MKDYIEIDNVRYRVGDAIHIFCDCPESAIVVDDPENRDYMKWYEGIVMCIHHHTETIPSMCIDITGNVGTGAGCNHSWKVDQHNFHYRMRLVKPRARNPFLLSILGDIKDA